MSPVAGLGAITVSLADDVTLRVLGLHVCAEVAIAATQGSSGIEKVHILLDRHFQAIDVKLPHKYLVWRPFVRAPLIAPHDKRTGGDDHHLLVP